MKNIQTIRIWDLHVLFAINLHKVTHGWIAKKFCDKTAANMGRLSLNPLKRIDSVGTIVVPNSFSALLYKVEPYGLFILLD